MTREELQDVIDKTLSKALEPVNQAFQVVTERKRALSNLNEVVR